MEPGAAAVGEHPLALPSWDCAACGQPWPCAARRESYLKEYRGARISLGLAMASWLVTAINDLPQEPVDALYVRFLGWIRQPPGPVTTPPP